MARAAPVSGRLALFLLFLKHHSTTFFAKNTLATIKAIAK